MVSITALSAYGWCCRPLTAWYPLHISGSGVGTGLGSRDISGSGVGSISKTLNTCVCITTRYSGCWRRVGVWGGNPFWYHIGWWSGPGPGVLVVVLGWCITARCAASSCWSQACALGSWVCSLFVSLGSSLGFRPSRGASCGPPLGPFLLPPGALAGACGAPSLSRGPGWGPRAPLVQVPYGLRPKHTGA